MKQQVYIGKMDRRIEIVKRIKVRGSTGAETFTETTIASVWAERKTIKSEEALDEKIVTINEQQYIIRYHPDIAKETVQHLFIKDDVIEYDIYGFNPIGRKEYLIIECERRE